MKEICTARGVRLALCSRSSKILNETNVPQQVRGSLDCGPVVCYLIECLLWGKRIVNENWSHGYAGEYRSHMVSSFYETIHGVHPQ